MNQMVSANDFPVGSRVRHPYFGLGVVISAKDEDQVSVRFDNCGEKRLALKYAQLRLVTESDEQSCEANKSWLDVFHFETEGARHYLGSHWEPFSVETGDLIKKLPELLPQALPQVSYSDNKASPRSLPGHWPTGAYLAWPQRTHGLQMAMAIKEDALYLVSLFPIFLTGSQHSVEIRAVHVWDGGLEAQIECLLGEAPISFFDTLYVSNRVWYAPGKICEFILSGIAYSCAPATSQKFEVNSPQVLSFLQEMAVENGENPDDFPAVVQCTTAEMAAFLPIDEWDRDDYTFRGPVNKMEEIEMLGQPAWKLQVTVMRFEADCDLAIVVSRRAWRGDTPPQLGQYVEGRLWLQGYLWLPGRVPE